jgi:putative copper resistance protein D
MLAPMFLVLGAPVTLALRSIAPRHDGTRGAREWLVATVECRYMRVLTRPPVVAVLFAGTLVLFYFSSLLPLALSTHVGHEIMHTHFLFAGYLMAWVLIGVDPGPGRPEPPMRLVLLFATMAFHAFYGLALIRGTAVLAPEYFGALGRIGAGGTPIWGLGLLEDQQYGGGVAWGIGDLPTLALALIVAVQWTRTDEREARRLDRAADRDGNADLNAYNEKLAQLARDDRD